MTVRNLTANRAARTSQARGTMNWKWLAGAGAAVMMIKQVRAVMGTAAAAAMVIGLGVTPVAAATATWTVTPGGKFYTLGHLATPDLTDATTGARFPCPTGFVISGTLKSGTGLADPIGTIATAKGRAGSPLVLQCTGNGLELTVTFSGLPWQVRATRYDSASAGTTTGILTGVAWQGRQLFPGRHAARSLTVRPPARETAESGSPTPTMGTSRSEPGTCTSIT